MPIQHNSIVPAEAAVDDTVTRSLRFDTNGKLSRTFGTPNSKKKFTFACWLKRAGFSSSTYKEIWQYDHNGSGGGFGFTNYQGGSNAYDADEFSMSSRNATTGVGDCIFHLTGLSRDPAAWMHIAFVVDTTQANDYDRLKLFINNTRRTDYDSNQIWPALDYEFNSIFCGTATTQNIGLRHTNDHPLNGYLADLYFIDGAAIEPDTNFIESTGYGSYKPKAFNMSSYSGNSFHIDAQPAHDADLLVSSIDRNDGDELFADCAGHALTKGGDPEHSVAVGNPFTGDGRAIYFDGSGDYLTSTDAKDDANFNNSDWTLEFWANPSTTFGSVRELFMGCGGGVQGWNSTDGHNWNMFAYGDDNEIWVQYWDGSSYTTIKVDDDLIPANTWTHVALVQQSGTVRWYIGGVQRTTSTTSFAAISTPSSFRIGDSAALDGETSNWSLTQFEGYIYDVSIQRGYCKYEDGTTFTPPTSKITADSNTELLLQPEKDDSSFEDESSNGHTITATGSPTRTASTPYDAAAKSTAMYFDGTGDNLVVTSDSSFNEFGTGDFTIEMWVNPTDQGSGSFAQMFELYGSSSDRMYLRVERQSSQDVYKFVVSGSDNFDVESDSAPDYGNWHHLAVVRNGTSITMYVDGTAQTDSVTISSSATYNWASTALNIGKGSLGGSSADYEGYIFDYRITKGTALYTSNFTPPTSKLSDDSSSLLLQPTKTDTSIGDSSSNSHTVTTAGSPTITASTPYNTTAKSTAISFDGTGDYLSVATSSDFDFGSGSYTYEGWFYFNGFSQTPDGIFSRNNSSTQEWAVCTNSSGTLQFFESVNNSYNTSSFTFSTGQWYHIALCKNGTTYKVYVDGSEKISATLSSAPDDNLPVIIGRFYDNYDGYYLDGYCYDFRAQKGVDTSGAKPSAPLELNPVYIGGDQSGNKNHFQPTNISSHDVMLDTPTKNYAVINPLNGEDSSHAEYSEGNLHITYNNAGQATTFGATMAFPKTGKWYAEVYIKSYGSPDSTRPKIGICRSDYHLTQYNNDTGQLGSADCFHYQKGGDKGGNSAGSLSYGASHTTGDIIGVAFDSGNGTLTFYKNGTSQGQAFSGLTKEYILATSGYDTSNSGTDDSVILNFGQDPTFAGNYTETPDSAEWAHSPPTDFKSLNTSNLDDPTVTPSENFNSLVYQGASPSDKAVTGVGFQPDLVWIKARTQAYSHAVYDSLRGATKELHTNTTDSEDTDSNGLKTFDSDGFTVGSDGEVGDPTGTRISWNWKAHQTPTSTRTTYTVKVEDSGGDAWDANSSFYDSSTYLPSVYMELWENQSSGLVSLGKVAVRSLDEAGNSTSDTSEQTYELKCVDLNAITVKWHYDTSGDGDSSDFPNSYNDLLNEQKITILDGSTSEWTTNNSSNDDGGTGYNYSPPSGWANGDSLKSATTSYTGSETATLTSGSGPVEKYNAAAGFSIITYSGNGSSDGDTQEITHTLGAEPEFIIAKSRSSSVSEGSWHVYHKHAVPYADSGYGTHAHLHLNQNYAAYQLYYNILIPKSGSENTIINTVYDNSDGLYTNESGVDYVMYAWAGVEGYSKFGKYTGNGVADGPFIYTGFRPRWIMVKPSENDYAWYIHDTARSPYNYSDNELAANTSGAEYSVSGAGAGERFDILSNGFKHRTSNDAMNGNDKTFLYAAFAESPFKYANAR